MNTVEIRWLGTKKTRVVDLPVGLLALSDKTGEVVCNPVGVFPADEGRKLLSLPGASSLFALESEYQAARGNRPAAPAPAAKVTQSKKPSAKKKTSAAPSADDPKRQAMLERVRKMNEVKAAKRAAAAQTTAAVGTATGETEGG